MKMMNAISLGQYPAINGSRAITGVKQIRTRVMMFGRVHSLDMLPQRLDHVLADGLQGVEHTLTGERHGFEVRGPLHPLSVFLADEELGIVVRIRLGTLLGRFGYRPARIERRLQL